MSAVGRLGIDLVSGLGIGGIYALMALGLTMIYGVLRVLHIAHGAVYALGTYLGLGLYLTTGDVVLALAGAMIGCAAAGGAIFAGVYRPLLGRPRYVPLVVSIGLLILLQDVYRLLWGPYTLPFRVAAPVPGVRIGTVPVTPHQVLVLLVAAVLLAVVWGILHGTRLGLAWKAAAEDLGMAGALGVNLTRVVAANFMLGSGLAGAAGVLVGMYYGEAFPTIGFLPSYKGFVIIVLGGMGRIGGAVVAALILGLAETLIVSWVGFVLPRDAIAFLIMIAVLIGRPQGLLGERA